jgi:hypothetical protein
VIAVPIEVLDEGADHVRGPLDAHVIVEHGDYECPYSRGASREIERVEPALDRDVRFAFRHFPLTQIHPHALAAAAEAAAAQERFWDMHILVALLTAHLGQGFSPVTAVSSSRCCSAAPASASASGVPGAPGWTPRSSCLSASFSECAP